MTPTERRGTALSARREWVRKLAVWSAVALLLAVLEESFFARLFGFAANPDLILAMTLCVALRSGEKDGAAAGVCAGFLSDAVAGATLSLSPLFGFAAGYLCGYYGRGFFQKEIANFAVWLGITAASKQFLLLLWRLVCDALGRTSVAVAYGPFLTFFYDLLGTVLFAFPVYAVARLWRRRAAVFSQRSRDVISQER